MVQWLFCGIQVLLLVGASQDLFLYDLLFELKVNIYGNSFWILKSLMHSFLLAFIHSKLGITMNYEPGTLLKPQEKKRTFSQRNEKAPDSVVCYDEVWKKEHVT